LPLYEYRCTQCGHRFEKIQSFSAEAEVECPKCGGLLERPLTAPAFQFKGAGWYVNDYAPKAASSSPEKPAGDAAPAAGEAKPASESKPAAESKPATAESAPKPAPSATSASAS
jgi:putative FmdB family regulatory protein